MATHYVQSPDFGFRILRFTGKLLPAGSQQGGETVGRETRLVQQQTVHFFHDVVAHVVAGPAQTLQVVADALPTALAQLVGLAADVAFVDAEQPRDLALTQAVA